MKNETIFLSKGKNGEASVFSTDGKTTQYSIQNFTHLHNLVILISPYILKILDSFLPLTHFLYDC